MLSSFSELLDAVSSLQVAAEVGYMDDSDEEGSCDEGTDEGTAAGPRAGPATRRVRRRSGTSQFMRACPELVTAYSARSTGGDSQGAASEAAQFCDAPEWAASCSAKSEAALLRPGELQHHAASRAASSCNGAIEGSEKCHALDGASAHGSAGEGGTAGQQAQAWLSSSPPAGGTGSAKKAVGKSRFAR
jgi:hypothetical protein